MGTVHDAIDPALGCHVALKVLSPTLASDAKRLQRFVQEAKAASALNHPHLVSIYEFGSDESDGKLVHFIAMEKVDGKILREILAKEALPLRRALELHQQKSSGAASDIQDDHAFGDRRSVQESLFESTLRQRQANRQVVGRRPEVMAERRNVTWPHRDIILAFVAVQDSGAM
jgi:serine/threonine protein kinase